MQTRAQTNYEKNILYTVNIDFDEASMLWKTNKCTMGNGVYKYVCIQKNKNGNSCVKKCLPGEEYCCRHFKMIQIKIKK